MTESVDGGDDDREPPGANCFHPTGMEVADRSRVFTRFMPGESQPNLRSADRSRRRPHLLAPMAIAVCLLCPVHAQPLSEPQQGEPQQAEPAETGSSMDASPQVPPERSGELNQDSNSKGEDKNQGEDKNRIFGVLPNYSTVERNMNVPPITTKATFKMFALGTFDPYVFPFVAFTASIAQLDNDEPSWGRGVGAFGKRYVTAFSDNAIGNFMTSAVAPTLLHQDPRYFVLGEGGFLRRAGYALSRSVITRTRAGRRTFNLSEIGGNAVAAGISNAYHPPEDRTWSGTVSRWGIQVMWDTLTNELKEFWPDIRRRI
jgi:hypothetical protein